MNKISLIGIAISATLVWSAPRVQAQGALTFVSSLDAPSAGTALVASDSWQAAPFWTGPNPGGYALDAVQLAMEPASGLPSDFTVEIYSAGNTVVPPGADGPESSVGILAGPMDPSAGGSLTYTASGIVLSPSTGYFVVVTSATEVANGAFAWSFEKYAAPTTSGGWGGSEFYYCSSSNGLTWTLSHGDPQMAIMATDVPEPDPFVLMGLSGFLVFIGRRWRTKAQSCCACHTWRDK